MFLKYYIYCGEQNFYKIKKKPEDENIRKVRIDGKIYVLKSQMEQIARKI